MSRNNPSAITVAITLDPENKFPDADVVITPTLEEMRLLRTPEFEEVAKHFFQELVKASRDKEHLSSLYFQGDSLGTFFNNGYKKEDLALYFFQSIQYLLKENEFVDDIDIEDLEGYTFHKKETLHCSIIQIYASDSLDVSYYPIAVCDYLGLPTSYKRSEETGFIIKTTKRKLDVLLVEQMNQH